MLIKLKTLLFFFACTLIATTLWFASIIRDQGVDVSYWQQYKIAKVDIDQQGIATLVADKWENLFEAQGYVTAANRLWQMDLMRRQAGGGLSEWFGKGALAQDIKRYQEDWPAVAQRAYDNLSAQHRAYLDRYVKGINQFIQENPQRWGIEYRIMGVKPKPWTAQDSFLIILSMYENLSETTDKEWAEGQWRKHLSSDWEAFIFPDAHPWNKPLFGEDSHLPIIPKKENWLPATSVSSVLQPKVTQQGVPQEAEGSNSWAYRNAADFYLANDLHLRLSVPSLWYAVRFRLSSEQWLVGASIPGIPGVIIGMNNALAWSATNSGEDVDDYIEETISNDGLSYLDIDSQGNPLWKPLTIRHMTVKVKGGADYVVQAKFTHRGPLHQPDKQKPQFFSRLWLPLQKNLLSMPTFNFIDMHTWEEFNQAIDQFKGLSLHMTMLDREGNIGYRTSGTTINREKNGRYPQPAPTHWQGLAAPSSRHRLFISTAQQTPTFFASANQRLWSDPFGYAYGGDERYRRISELLQNDHLSLKDMQKIQLDTHSHFHKLLLDWVIRHSSANPNDAIISKWRQWDGFANSDEITFAQARRIHNKLYKLLLDRFKQALLPKTIHSLKYDWLLVNAWILALLEHPNGMQPLGFNNHDVGDYLLALAKQHRVKHSEDNLWQVQHPFAYSLPLIGRLFRIKAYPQPGYNRLVRAELGDFGSSIRVIWNMNKISNSLWSLQIGQSGHIGSKHYKDLHTPWFANQYFSVLDKRYQWE